MAAQKVLVPTGLVAQVFYVCQGCFVAYFAATYSDWNRFLALSFEFLRRKLITTHSSCPAV